MKTGFSSVELFRKYLWYALREHKFDPDTVADLIHLRQQLKLTDDEVRHIRVKAGIQGSGCATIEHLILASVYVFVSHSFEV